MAGDWPSVSLDDLVKIQHGYAFAGEYFRDEPPGDVLVTPGNFRPGGGFQQGRSKYYAGPVPAAFVLNQGDLIITMTDLSRESDALGFPARVPAADDHARFLHNQRLGRVIVRPGVEVDRDFLYYLLCTQQYRSEVLASATGTTVKHTSPSRIGRFRFELPPVAEQQWIADVLGTLDNKIELNRRTNETLEAIARALFKSWFVDFDPVRAKSEGRDSGLPKPLANLFPDSFEASELGEIPRGWRVALLSDIANVIDCSHAKKPERREHGWPLLQLSNIRADGLLDMTDTYLIDGSDYGAWTLRMEASPSDCVITNVGRVGAVAQIPGGLAAALGRNMTGVRCKPSFACPTFLLEALLSDALRNEVVLNTDTGTILDALNVRSIPRLRLVLPDGDLATRFEEIGRPIRAKMEANLEERRTLAALRDVLLPKLMSGELRVEDAERIAVGTEA